MIAERLWKGLGWIHSWVFSMRCVLDARRWRWI